jgi:precorrin-2 dehydrogenase/sirohydrochlorin ferrochelatase
LKAARLLSEADILVLGQRANSEIVALARRDAERLDAIQTEASALMALLAKGFCIVLIGAPSLAKDLAERGETVEALPVADG